MILLPVALVPLMVIAFYALGGGRGGKDGKGLTLTKGLNMSLPEAKFDAKKKVLNKLGFYKQSEQDSIRLVERRKMDPYYGVKDSAVVFGAARRFRLTARSVANGLDMGSASTDAQADSLMRKLDLLKGVLNRQEQGAMRETPLRIGAGRPSRSVEGLAGPSPMPFGRAPAMQSDPELDKLSTLMDKVLKIRYPGDPPLHDSSFHDSALTQCSEKNVQALTFGVREEIITTLPSEDGEDLQTGFIDLGDERPGDSLAERMIAAKVDEAQTLISGEAVSFRTAVDAMLGGTKVPRGTLLWGKCAISGERLTVTVNTVRLGDRVIPVSLEVLDMDGMAGIRVKGSINRDVSKESAGEAVGALGFTSLDPGVAGQAMAAGIQAAKNLLGRKIRLVRVGLPAGYKVLLRNTRINR